MSFGNFKETADLLVSCTCETVFYLVHQRESIQQNLKEITSGSNVSSRLLKKSKTFQPLPWTYIHVGVYTNKMQIESEYI